MFLFRFLSYWLWIIKMYATTLIPDTSNINNKWINFVLCTFNLTKIFFDKTAITFSSECFSKSIHTKTEWKYPCGTQRNTICLQGWSSVHLAQLKAPQKMIAVGTRLFVASHIRRRKSSSGRGLYSNLPPLVKCSKLGTDVIPNTPQRCIRWLTLADLRTPRSTNCVYIDIAHYYQMYKTLEILCLESCLLFTIWRWWE